MAPHEVLLSMAEDPSQWMRQGDDLEAWARSVQRAVLAVYWLRQHAGPVVFACCREGDAAQQITSELLSSALGQLRLAARARSATYPCIKP